MSTPDPFQDLVDVLRRTLTSTSTPTPPANTSAFPAASPSPPTIASPMAKPAPFSGSAEDCNGFLLQCSLVLEMQPYAYPDDKSKVAFIISQLNGKALRWAEPLWTQDNPVVQSLSSFTTHFKEVFGKPAWDSSIAVSRRAPGPVAISIRQPESVSQPESANDLMQIEGSRLSSAERQRRLT
ncbi:Retrotransposon Gag-like protein 6 [Anabarilius grahami]|uniref:Retrotransposon Gag-like protein 6 n=1 Tax=Anabarilius grahami TaxID=495550 RepID=A0A3N0YTH8_ANAGA|nr:Retrotransposon Gag-like protein 6 [Anabarilius grahami]